MDQVPILKIGQTLFVSIQIDLQDESVMLLAGRPGGPSSPPPPHAA